MSANKNKNKNYELITNKLISLIERGVKPWEKPWHTNGFSNFATGHVYRGSNPLIVQMDMLLYEYEFPYFLSYKQAAAKGWQVKKGSKATTLVYAGSFTYENEKEELKTGYSTRFYKVFNLACIDDSKGKQKIAELLPAKLPPQNLDNRIERIEAFASSQKIPIFHGGDRACYSPSADKISMPKFESFTNAVNYYLTLSHEFVHSTGHRDRLNRDLSGKFGTKKYAFEELVAEIGASFLAAELGIDSDYSLEHHASYLDNWLQLLKEDDRAFLRAVNLANSASKYLLANTPKHNHIEPIKEQQQLTLAL